MQFKVPQFLEIEDKIFGRFTFREFVYLAGGAGCCFILYKLLGLYLGAIPILAVAGLALTLTFYRPNDKPFVDMLEAGLKYILQNKLYIWKRRKNKVPTRPLEWSKAGVSSKQPAELNAVSRENLVRLGGNKLRDLAWSLDVLDLNKHKDNN